MASGLREVSENNFTLEIGPSRSRLCSFTISAKVTHPKKKVSFSTVVEGYRWQDKRAFRWYNNYEKRRKTDFVIGLIGKPEKSVGKSI